MPMIEFFIPGKATPKQSVNKGRSSYYTDPKAKNYEGIVRQFAFQAMKDLNLKPTTNAVKLEVTIFVTVPKKFSKKKVVLAHEGKVKPTTRPDLDNCTKVLHDGMNLIVYKDDSQITDEILSKRYAEESGIYIKAEWDA